MTLEEKQQHLVLLKRKLAEACLFEKTHGTIMFGVGTPEADLMIIGDSPGRTPDAGNLLKGVLARLQKPLAECYITNVVKFRKKATEADRDLMSPFLFAQIFLIQPKVILTLGGAPTEVITGAAGRMGHLRQMTRLRYSDSKHSLEIPVVSTWHPTYCLTQAPENKKPLANFIEDVRRALEVSNAD
tara:strand:+ start:334 stop:891 length:558 start_codon:yes stop_codon:yes gene_type:complete